MRKHFYRGNSLGCLNTGYRPAIVTLWPDVTLNFESVQCWLTLVIQDKIIGERDLLWETCEESRKSWALYNNIASLLCPLQVRDNISNWNMNCIKSLLEGTRWNPCEQYVKNMWNVVQVSHMFHILFTQYFTGYFTDVWKYLWKNSVKTMWNGLPFFTYNFSHTPCEKTCENARSNQLEGTLWNPCEQYVKNMWNVVQVSHMFHILFTQYFTGYFTDVWKYLWKNMWKCKV